LKTLSIQRLWLAVAFLAVCGVFSVGGVNADDENGQVRGGPDRDADEGEGTFKRMIIRGAILIDGSGAPPRGPVDIVIEGNRIASIHNVGVPHVPIDEGGRPDGAWHHDDTRRVGRSA